MFKLFTDTFNQFNAYLQFFLKKNELNPNVYLKKETTKSPVSLSI